MKRLIYISSATRALPDQELRALVERARINNRSMNVTGMLVLKNHTFLQVLEGESADVDKIFEIIQRDDRSTGIVTLVEEPIESRDFPDWFMGFSHLDNSGDEISELLQMTREPEASGSVVKPGASLELLKRFANR